MEYALIIYETKTEFENRKHPENEAFWAPWRAYHRALTEAGMYLGGTPLESEVTGTTIRVRGGERQVQDGPYADTKEQLGGLMLIEAPSLDVALEWASRCPAASYGAVEVRPAADLDHIFGPGSSIPPHSMPKRYP
jgi:hypothetical protein